MIAWHINKKTNIWVFLLVLVIGSNLILYRSPISPIVLPEETRWVILGSLFDLAIVSPLLMIAINKNRNFTVKRFIILMAGGLILARFLIPAKYFEPFVGVSYIGFAVEGLLIFLELTFLFILVRYMPAIIQQVRRSDESLIFSFPAAVEEKVRKHPIIQVAASELLMFYYAFFSWKKKPPIGEENFTMYKKSSLMAFQIMMIHATIIETLGIHWWLHNKSLVLSIVLLILNIYTVIFILGYIQSVRLNPLKLDDKYLYLSLGLAKKMVVSLDDIDSITMNHELLKQKIDNKTTIEFIARDFETVCPHMILNLKSPSRATLFLGFEKKYSRIALRLDDPDKFYEALKEHLSR
ncbi:beta-carotene 15,15'-monooxygenase [Heyndrickxia sp. NPDC080065]|uniref:beta-carotene 15,15'-monooxygenase n=1 Tax=Heyndrickxia sp. NPDC080065 TaxID=3390568 RepID=UPI003D01F378